jgi:hypothetical protein
LASSVLTQNGVVEAILIRHGALQTFTDPGSIATRALGIKNWGQVVGDYQNASGTHGFVGTPDHLRPVDLPGASQTMAYAINDWGQIAGTYDDSGGHEHGFLDTNGHFASVDVPGAQTTSVTGLNDWGQLVGSYVDSAGQTHGFVLTGGHFQTLDASGAFLTDATGINNLGQIVGYAESTSPGGASPQAEVWVARPGFIHGAQQAGPAIPEAEPPGTADVAALIRGIAGSNSGLPDLASWFADPTAGSRPAAIAALEAATGAGPQDWTGLPGAQAWLMQHAGKG